MYYDFFSGRIKFKLKGNDNTITGDSGGMGGEGGRGGTFGLGLPKRGGRSDWLFSS